MYCYLSTLRLNNGALLVGPKRRVVFANGVHSKDYRSNGGSATRYEVKRALAPLSGYWSKPSEADHVSGAPVQKDVPVMSFYEFRLKAKRLLTDAGLLEVRERDQRDEDEQNYQHTVAERLERHIR